ncbi:hypothetical protein P4631_07815 [Halalkalibacterium halodurans]|uniref:spr1630 family ClpXP-sensitive toxin n=1 Tax=Halalkalibacterium halodurans TaxID=86665 RepID=UPI002E1E4074|nr:hypothetical protein [Halalkalibacterium halodurans]
MSNIMDQYRMENSMGQAIVDGILQGYKDYLQERREKRQTMHISSAYAWTKGNHIDHNVAESSKAFKFAKARAGYTWGYLQFGHEQTKSMFIIKNGKYFNDQNFTKAKDIIGNSSDKKQENYLQRLATINKNVEFPVERDLLNQDNGVEFVSLLDPEILQEIEEPSYRQLVERYNRFYVVTYEIDVDYVISRIRLLMPNPSNGIAYDVQDLTDFISTSPVKFEEEDYETVIEEAKERDAMVDYGISFNIGKTKEGDQS